MEVDIKGLNKAKLLMELYNHSHQQGAGFLHLEGTKDITFSQAVSIIKEQGYRFDYLLGRVLKIDLEGDKMWVHLYDRDNYEGAAQECIDRVRQNKAI